MIWNSGFKAVTSFQNNDRLLKIVQNDLELAIV